MKLSTDDLVTVQCALNIAIQRLEAVLDPSQHAHSSLKHLKELKTHVDAELLVRFTPS